MPAHPFYVHFFLLRNSLLPLILLWNLVLIKAFVSLLSIGPSAPFLLTLPRSVSLYRTDCNLCHGSGISSYPSISHSHNYGCTKREASKSFSDGLASWLLYLIFFFFLPSSPLFNNSGSCWGLDYNCADISLRLFISYLALFRATCKKKKDRLTSIGWVPALKQTFFFSSVWSQLVAGCELAFSSLWSVFFFFFFKENKKKQKTLLFSLDL